MHVESASAAFLAGLGTGAHCLLMCGPLACALRVQRPLYHGTRILSYTALGAIGGGLGQWLLQALHFPLLQIAPWALLATLLLLATGLHKRIPLPAPTLPWAKPLRLERSLGWITPLIPCGPLWLMLATATASQSVLSGGLLLLSFALGTVVLYAGLPWGLAQFPKHFRLHIPPLQQATLWIATALLAWRLWKGGPHGCCAL